MLKGGSLIYAIVISVIIAMLSSSLILLSYFTSVHVDYYSDLSRIQLNAASGVSLLLSNQQTINSGDDKIIDLFGKGIDSVHLKKNNWGAFDVGVSEAFSKHNRYRKILLMGGIFSKDTALALYLEDEDKPLSLCGETVIKGTCFLPKAGVKRAYIEGQNFVGEKLIDGGVKESKKIIPGVDKIPKVTGVNIRCVGVVDVYITPCFKCVGIVINNTAIAIEIRSILF